MDNTIPFGRRAFGLHSASSLSSWNARLYHKWLVSKSPEIEIEMSVSTTMNNSRVLKIFLRLCTPKKQGII